MYKKFLEKIKVQKSDIKSEDQSLSESSDIDINQTEQRSEHEGGAENKVIFVNDEN